MCLVLGNLAQADSWGLIREGQFENPKPAVSKLSTASGGQLRLEYRHGRQQDAGVIAGEQLIWVTEKDE
jgi:hypothetical protein